MFGEVLVGENWAGGGSAVLIDDGKVLTRKDVASLGAHPPDLAYCIFTYYPLYMLVRRLNQCRFKRVIHLVRGDLASLVRIFLLLRALFTKLGKIFSLSFI